MTFYKLTIDSILQKRNTNLKTRTVHLLKHAFYLSKEQKSHYLQRVDKLSIDALYLLFITLITIKHINKHIIADSALFSKTNTDYSKPIDYVMQTNQTDIQNYIISTFNIKTKKATLYTQSVTVKTSAKSKSTDSHDELKSTNLNDVILLIAFTLFNIHIVIQKIARTQAQSKITIPLYYLDSLLMASIILTNITNTQYNYKDLVPKLLQRYVKRFYLHNLTLLGLSNFIQSKKKAKKYLRILHKRLKFYAKKKRPWIK